MDTRVRDVQSDCFYVLFSVKHPRLALDLSGSDRKTVLGFGFHGGCNQRWLAHRHGAGWIMRSLLTTQYASVEDNQPQRKIYPNGTKVVVSNQPCWWRISKENDAELSSNPTAPAKFRVSLLDAKKSIHIPGDGEDTILEIRDSSQDEAQLWYFSRVAFVRDLQSGHRYKLVNAKQIHRALDLSGNDHRMVIGFQSHEGENQQWDLHQDRGGSALICVRLGGHLLPQGYHPCRKNYPNGTRVIASQQPFRWTITKENDTELKNNSHIPAKFRLYIPDSGKCLDLADYGRGCNAEVWSQSGDHSQLWYFELLS